jgi:hypothetical protein
MLPGGLIGARGSWLYNCASFRTSVGKVIFLIVRRKKGVALGGDGLFVAEVLVFDLGELDHCGGLMCPLEVVAATRRRD